MLATKHIVSEQRLFEAMIALLSLKIALVATLALSFVALVLLALSLLFQAIFQLCEQLALTWAQCNAIEKLLFLLIAWAFAAWILKRVKGFSHAA